MFNDDVISPVHQWKLFYKDKVRLSLYIKYSHEKGTKNKKNDVCTYDVLESINIYFVPFYIYDLYNWIFEYHCLSNMNYVMTFYPWKIYTGLGMSRLRTFVKFIIIKYPKLSLNTWEPTNIPLLSLIPETWQRMRPRPPHGLITSAMGAHLSRRYKVEKAAHDVMN